LISSIMICSSSTWAGSIASKVPNNNISFVIYFLVGIIIYNWALYRIM
jgi:hypothetical protein